ncbi:hypothetical protein C0993_004934 [Termitomyces sp. T159_Od127]|nr:hypothetical protein C0993_004934 [Termitomyces sp. T159_Od127]
MDFGLETRTALPHQTPQEWQALNTGPSSSSTPPSAFASSSLGFFPRRRSSAAHRPAGPPPNLPIPNVPVAQPFQHDPSAVLHEDTTVLTNGRSMHAASAIRPPPLSSSAPAVPSPNRSSHTTPHSSVEDLSDPPPLSILPQSSSRVFTNTQELSNHSQAPRESRRESRVPSSRRALTRALELAREAVQIDSTNDNPEAAVQAYGRSVALLSEVMERVRRGEDSTENHRRHRRRSVAAQEEEIRRLQNIHDTYADRMNILSIIYSIPTVPYTSSSMYSALSQPSPTSPTSSASPSSESSPRIPQGLNVPADPPATNYVVNEGSDHDHDRDFDSTDALNSVMFLGDSSSSGGLVSGLPYSSHHPYATPYPVSEANVHPARGHSVPSRRTRSPSNLPPLQPPPTKSIPPAPNPKVEIDFSSQQKSSDVHTRQPGDSVGHITAGPGLDALAEEYDDVHLDSHQIARETSEVESTGAETIFPAPETPRNANRESHPLPPLPSAVSQALQPSRSPPRPGVSRHRGSSTLTEYPAQSTFYQRRNKSSVPPTPRSSSPADSTISAASAPKSAVSTLPVAMPPLPKTRARSLSQPDRHPSIIGNRTPPPDQSRPPLPAPSAVSGTGARKASVPSRMHPTPPLNQLFVTTDRLSFIPPQVLTNNLPTTPTSPLPPVAPDDPLLKPYHLMNLLRNTMTSPTGGYVTRKLHVPHEVWSQGGAKLTNVLDKERVVTILCNALEDLQVSSAEHFGAGNVGSGLASGIGSIGRKEANAWSAKLEEFSSICDGVATNFGKKLGVGEGFVLKKSTWGDKLTRGFDKITNGKNPDSPFNYVRNLERLFQHTQLLDEHTKAILTQPTVPAYAAFPPELRTSTEQRLKRASEFFSSVVLTFVIRDLSQLLDKYAKQCEKWLAE